MAMIVQGDCVALMAELPEASVDVIVTDPPYGLEFMGKEWDRLSDDLPRHGQGGALNEPDPGPWGRRQRVNYGGAQNRMKRCAICGKREFSGSPCQCDQPEWIIETPERAPSSMIRMQRWHEAWAREALRVLKPGGHLLAFGGTRTYHRLACAIEDAGFEIRDCLAWLYGSGFPKSLDVSKAIDKAAGVEREPGRPYLRPGDGKPYALGAPEQADGVGSSFATGQRCPIITAPATSEAEQWQGWGTALKPAHEPIVLARKPLAGTVAANILSFGTGALNIDGTRIEHASPDDLATSQAKNPGREDLVSSGVYGNGRPQQSVNDSGRWPANVLLDEQAAAMLDEQTGNLHAQDPSTRNSSSPRSGVIGFADGGLNYSDSGGASRFLYVAKASSAERNAGLDGFEEGERVFMGSGGRTQVDGEWVETHSEPRQRANVHPTVKPIELMRWLVRLVTPPNGTILDPFSGSGTTGCAAVLEGFNFIGMEREAEYVKIAEARIAWWSQHPDGLEIVKGLEADRERRKHSDAGQLGLLG